LRRAQALASQSTLALVLSRSLIRSKLEAERATLKRFSDRLPIPVAEEAIRRSAQQAAEAATIEDLRVAEAWAAAGYWQAFTEVPVRFAQRDRDRVPSHWLTFGGRSSPLGNGPRLAANPANAVLNYLYALLEAETSLACRTVGLDPGLGVMHVDQQYRDSLTSDLMEPVRPLVDRYAFELLTTRAFAARDFFETRTGVCRVTAPLTHELVASCNHWRRQVGRVVEQFAEALEERGPKVRETPTPISGRRRSEGRPSGPRVRTDSPTPKRMMRACSWCGGPTSGGRATCGAPCELEVGRLSQQLAARAASLRMKDLAKRPGHPALTAEANERRRQTLARNREAELAWKRANPKRPDPQFFLAEILPGLAGTSATALAKVTGLSVTYCADIIRGERVPHPRWWGALSEADLKNK
jgi:CRISPR-associated endonuclease Cas1